MSSFPTIESIKEEINKFTPSSVEFYAFKSYNGKICFSRKHGILPPKEESKYTKLVASVIREDNNNNDEKPKINVDLTLKRVYLNALSSISYGTRYKMNRKQMLKLEEIHRWLRKKEIRFSNGWNSTAEPWVEDASIESLLKVGLWLSERELSITVRDQLIEVIKLLIIKEKERNGK